MIRHLLNSNLLSAVALATIGGLAGLRAAPDAAAAPASVARVAQDQDSDQGDDKLEIGEDAPAFEVSDSQDRTHTLADYADRIVVLVWVDPGCPFTQRILENQLLHDARKKMKELDEQAVLLTVTSNAAVTKQEAERFRRRYNLEVPLLLDTDGTVASRYDARMTPHVFIIDDEGTLAYAGAFDTDPSGADAEKGRKVTNYIVNTVEALHNDDEVKPSKTRPYGCKIKLPEKSGDEDDGSRRARGNRRGGG